MLYLAKGSGGWFEQEFTKGFKRERILIKSKKCVFVSLCISKKVFELNPTLFKVKLCYTSLQ